MFGRVRDSGLPPPYITPSTTQPTAKPEITEKATAPVSAAAKGSGVASGLVRRASIPPSEPARLTAGTPGDTASSASPPATSGATTPQAGRKDEQIARLNKIKDESKARRVKALQPQENEAETMCLDLQSKIKSKLQSGQKPEDLFNHLIEGKSSKEKLFILGEFVSNRCPLYFAPEPSTPSKVVTIDKHLDAVAIAKTLAKKALTELQLLTSTAPRSAESSVAKIHIATYERNYNPRYRLDAIIPPKGE